MQTDTQEVKLEGKLISTASFLWQVKYKRTGTQDFTVKEIRGNPDQTTFLVADTPTYVEYEIEVVAWNSQGNVVFDDVVVAAVVLVVIVFLDVVFCCCCCFGCCCCCFDVAPGY